MIFYYVIEEHSCCHVFLVKEKLGAYKAYKACKSEVLRCHKPNPAATMSAITPAVTLVDFVNGTKATMPAVTPAVTLAAFVNGIANGIDSGIDCSVVNGI